MSDTSFTAADPGDSIGLRCRRCRSQQFRVLYTRRRAGCRVVRRRECRQCGDRFTTCEHRLGS